MKARGKFRLQIVGKEVAIAPTGSLRFCGVQGFCLDFWWWPIVGGNFSFLPARLKAQHYCPWLGLFQAGCSTSHCTNILGFRLSATNESLVLYVHYVGRTRCFPQAGR
jgi:hypothetical protein